MDNQLLKWGIRNDFLLYGEEGTPLEFVVNELVLPGNQHGKTPDAAFHLVKTVVSDWLVIR
jgi:hypothetical protein